MTRQPNRFKYDEIINQMVETGWFRVTCEGHIETCYQWRACQECIVPWFRCDRRDGSGYYYVSFRRNRVKAHRLAYALYHGSVPAGAELNHRNGVGTDNRRENIELSSPPHNSRHAYRTGLNKATGENHALSKLTTEAVIEARRASTAGVPYTVLARRYGVTAVAMRLACIGKTWAHVPFEEKTK